MRKNRLIAIAGILFILLTLISAGCSIISPESLRERYFGSKASSEENLSSYDEANDSDGEGSQRYAGSENESNALRPDFDLTEQPSQPDSAEDEDPETAILASQSVPTSRFPSALSPAPVIPIESITLDVTSITINKNTEHKISHSIAPNNATDRSVTYQSTDEAVVIVTNEGRLFAVGAGSAVIHCVSASGDIVASCEVIVVVPVSRVTVTTDRNLFKTGETCSFSVSVFPEDATDKDITISVSNSIAEVASGNSITCLSSGRVAIIATSSNGVSVSREIDIINLAEFAAEVFRLTNNERQNHGLADFSSNSELTATAVLRAGECEAAFSHTRPDGRDCFTAFSENGVSYIRAAENLAYGQLTPAEVVAGWMNSPGHRANILNERLGSLGVGVELGSNGRLYWAQSFTD